jgi:hypothetical protein
MSSSTRRSRRASLAALTLLALALAACSGATAAPSGVATIDGTPSPSGDAAASPSASVSPEDAMLAFARCMREHGVDMPDPQVAGNGQDGAIRVDLGDTDPSTLQAAQEACDELLQQAGVGPRGSISPEAMDRVVEFAECMREHGIDMPDPQTNGGGIMIGGGPGSDGGGIDPSSPEFQDAQEACQDLLPGFGPDGGPSTNVSNGS